MPEKTITPHRADLDHIAILDRVQLELSDHPIDVPWCIEVHQDARWISVVAIAIKFRCKFTITGPRDGLRLLPKFPNTPRPSQDAMRELFEATP